MAIVKDTESFIRAARAIHGERYDYSRTVWNGSQSGITIICRVCGPFVLKHAECHYRKRKPCGCKKCNKKAGWLASDKMGRPKVYKTCDCGFSGYGVKDFPPNAGGKCKECWNAIQAQKRQSARDLLLRPCETCGRPIGSTDSRKVVCSNSCRYKRSRKERAVVDCCVCGKSVQRYKKALEARSKFACSNECQRVWAGMRGAGVLAKVGSDKWKLSQEKARKAWYRSQSVRRRNSNEWLCAVNRKKKSAYSPDRESWDYRVGLRLGAASGRRNRKKIEPKHSRTIEQAFRRLRSRRKYFELTDWQKKVGLKLSSHKARRSRKREAKRAKGVKGIRDRGEDPKQWVQVCFEWVGN